MTVTQKGEKETHFMGVFLLPLLHLQMESFFGAIEYESAFVQRP